MIPAIAESASGKLTSNAIDESIVYQIARSDPNQIDIHQSHVNKYPNVVEGGKRFQTLLRSHSKIMSVVNRRESLNVAKDSRARCISEIFSILLSTGVSIRLKCFVGIPRT
jgi:predicted transcriptional regulator